MKENTDPTQDIFVALMKRQISHGSDKIKKTINKNKSALNILRSLKPLNCDRKSMMVSEQKQQHFDQIINRFQSSKIKYSINSPLSKSSLFQEKNIQRQNNMGSSVNRSVYTERMKQNLSDLRNNYLVLPTITARSKELRESQENNFHQDYSQFDPNSKKSKERKSLGMIILQKFKSVKTEIDL